MKFFYLSWNSMEQYVHLNVEQAVHFKENYWKLYDNFYRIKEHQKPICCNNKDKFFFIY